MLFYFLKLWGENPGAPANGKESPVLTTAESTVFAAPIDKVKAESQGKCREL